MGLELTVPRKFPALRRKPDTVGEVIGAFESDTVGVLQRSSPANESVVIFALSAILIIAIAFACIVKVDRVVTSVAGIIVTSAGSLYVSPYNASVVRELKVKVGQVVKKGQILARLDPTFTQADLMQLIEHMDSDAATVAREAAELAKVAYQFSPTDKYQATQGRIWMQRQAQYHSDVANFDAQISSTEAQMTQAVSDADKYKARLKLASDAEHIYEPLLDKGYVSKLQVMQSTDVTTEMSRLVADAQQQISQYRETATALRAQRESYIQKWFADTAVQLVLDRNDLELTRDNLVKAQKLQDLTSLVSPTDAIVVQIGKMSPGSIAPGNGSDMLSPNTSPLFTLAPLSAAVEAELNIATTDVGFIKVGDPVVLKLDTYPYVMYGTGKGVVKTISEGSFSLDANNTPVLPYFKVRVKATEFHLHDVPPDFRLVPGATLTGDIVAGERTIMSYLTETIQQQGSEAMREPQ